jgi:hypothetical protein
MLPIIGLLSPIIGKVLDKIPDAGKKAELELELQKVLLENEDKLRSALIQSDTNQTEINKIEAASDSKFKSGWRPALAWVGVFAIAWAGLIAPVVVFFIELFTGKVVGLPKIDTGLFMTIMTGLLGLGYYRTQEKKDGLTK